MFDTCQRVWHQDVSVDPDHAKALLPFKGKPMINHIVDKIPQDIEILVNVNKKFEADFLEWQKAAKQESNYLR